MKAGRPMIRRLNRETAIDALGNQTSDLGKVNRKIDLGDGDDTASWRYRRPL